MPIRVLEVLEDVTRENVGPGDPNDVGTALERLVPYGLLAVTELLDQQT